jgi:uncharacterized protein YggE
MGEIPGVVAFVACAFWPVACWSDDNHSLPPTLTVSAEGKVRVPPDKALVRLAVETAGESLETVQEENRKKMRKILNRLQELGIEEKHMQTSSLNVTPHYPPRHRRQGGEPSLPEVPKIIGYTVNHSLTVEVHELDSIGRVVDSALKAGANRFSQITWALKDERPAQLEALKIASQDARGKAKVLAEALGVKLDRLLEVTEGRAAVLPRRQLATARMSMAMAESSDVDPGI